MKSNAVSSLTSNNVQKSPLKDDYLPFLDGFRGIAALWVVAFHSLLLTNVRIPIINQGYVAVELFMIMSGFLMVYHYYVREKEEPWEQSKTWFTFFIRRYFRIAPLYYFLFLIYLIIGPAIGHFREGIFQIYQSADTLVSRYSDRSFSNIFMHISFLFGMFPKYSFRTPMPDWSIGLEMQFYFLFPFLMLLFRKNLFLISTTALFIFSKLLNRFVIKQAFGAPSFITLSLNYFLIGMLLATLNYFKNDRLKSCLAAGGALVLALFSREILVVLITVLIILLIIPDLTWRPIRVIYNLLSNRFTAWLADMSYSVYLLHLVFMTPIAYFYIHFNAFLNLPGILRFLILFISTCLPTYLTSILLFNFIEMNGIIWGKKIVKRLNS